MVCVVTSSIILLTPYHILNIWRRGRLTALHKIWMELQDNGLEQSEPIYRTSSSCPVKGTGPGILFIIWATPTTWMKTKCEFKVSQLYLIIVCYLKLSNQNQHMFETSQLPSHAVFWQVFSIPVTATLQMNEDLLLEWKIQFQFWVQSLKYRRFHLSVDRW